MGHCLKEQTQISSLPWRREVWAQGDGVPRLVRASSSLPDLLTEFSNCGARTLVSLPLLLKAPGVWEQGSILITSFHLSHLLKDPVFNTFHGCLGRTKYEFWEDTTLSTADSTSALRCCSLQMCWCQQVLADTARATHSWWWEMASSTAPHYFQLLVESHSSWTEALQSSLQVSGPLRDIADPTFPPCPAVHN